MDLPSWRADWIADHKRPISDPELSPDGRRAAFVTDDRDSADLWVVDIDRNASTAIAAHVPGLKHPIWSSDGQRIIFAAIGPGGGNNNLYDIASAGGSWRPSVPEEAGGNVAVGSTRAGVPVWLQFTGGAPALSTLGPDRQPKPLIHIHHLFTFQTDCV